MAKITLTPVKVSEIKARLWEGATQTAVAIEFKKSSSLIGNILSGNRWANIEWPNGRTGPLPRSRRAEIVRARKSVKVDAAELVKEKLG